MKNGIKIMNIEGSDILKDTYKEMVITKNYNGVFASSLLLKKLRTDEIGLKVERCMTKDVIMVNFSYGYTPKTTYDIIDEIIVNKSNINGNAGEVTELLDVKKQLTLQKKPYVAKVNELMKERKLQINNEAKKPFTDKIAELQSVIKDLKSEDEIKPYDNEIKQIKKLIKNSTNANETESLNEQLEKLKKINISNNQKSINVLNDNTKAIKDCNVKLKNKIDESKIDKDSIRDILYEEGFTLNFYKKRKDTKDSNESKDYDIVDTIDYEFWFRSPSKSKTGSVCFINKKLHDKINVWQTMGIELPDTEAKLVEMEAYKSLTSSNVESEIIINPKTQILVVSDLDSYIDEMCSKVFVNRTLNANTKIYKITKYIIEESTVKAIKVKVSKNIIKAIKINRTCSVKDGVMKIKNVLWDGMALISDELFKGSNGMMVLRQHFFKACGFRTCISEFMINWCDLNGKDYNTYTVKDRYGRDVFVKNIKMITTENAMKWEKFLDRGIDYEYWCEKVQEDDNIFGVCKVDHKSKYGDKQRMSFQMINTLPINEKQTFNLCKDTIEYVDSLKKDNKVFLSFLERTKSDVNANAMIIDLYNNNKTDFDNSELFRTFKVETISDYKKTLRAGKLLTNADNLTICGNPYVLLLHSVGALDKYIVDNIIENYEDITLPTLPKKEGVSVYTTKFEDEELASFRSPHNSPNNILFFRNKRTNPIMDKYFKFSKNIIAVDLLNTNCQSRGNGFDEDSDFVYTTNSSVCIQGAKEAQSFNTIENCIEQTGKKYNNTMADLSVIDSGLARGRYAIGLASNMAQIAMSWYWNTPTQELKDIVCSTSILAQCSIDSSKREFRINIGKEIARINKLDCMQVKINDDKEMVTLGVNATDIEKEQFKNMKLAKPLFWQFIKVIKEKQGKKIREKIIEEEGKLEEEIEKLECEEKTRTLPLKISQKQKQVKEKSVKSNKLKEHCVNNKICPMDYVQSAIDTIRVCKNPNPYTSDIEFVKDMEGKADNKQLHKVKEIVKSLDDMYKKHFSELKKGKEIDDDDWSAEEQIKTEDSLDAIDKIHLTPKTMQMLITNTLISNGTNKIYKRRMLNCLYKSRKHKKTFLSMFI
ncbi:hypothetical protein K2F43_00860 [Clostridium estertheticum]|uniref:hypothetical protein n=1 Tax=Clostridium estertheticum TaxID=238834 RepID=UPI001C6F3EE3|nr:hypothetical protein [Clostridium estertheticum]MBW9169751.1 hypothetical protein [Clostridium estertheticum]WLC74743.1 hypothetical protein KTC99_18605 [Clostridium estertheticum]